MVIGEAAGDQAGDGRVGDQGQVVAVLFEAAHGEDGDGGAASTLVAGGGLRDQFVHEFSISHQI
ncbi:hypothetical protein GCM10010319_09180 [Streptomyces blastmyceticus]|uniref:Uncharacterized protein n=1 Tax=Streptomyces blastmyceticus TaxID=68180 RepID=A0ABN0WF50_9ACTN